MVEQKLFTDKLLASQIGKKVIDLIFNPLNQFLNELYFTHSFECVNIKLPNKLELDLSFQFVKHKV
jgi:hypothetical protein